MRYKNLDKFSKIIIGRGGQIGMFYNNYHNIYHDTKHPHYVKGYYKKCRLYTRRVYFDFGHEFALGVRIYGIRMIRY
jgi:hypothetical protein